MYLNAKHKHNVKCVQKHEKQIHSSVNYIGCMLLLFICACIDKSENINQINLIIELCISSSV